jgi:hypothetical protein
MQRFAFGILIMVCLIAVPESYCQQIRSITQSPVAQMPQEIRGWMNSDSLTTEIYRVGVGGGVITGDASAGAFAPVFTSFFAFPLSSSASGEIALHRAPFFRVTRTGFLTVSGTWFIDGMLAFSPLRNVPNFRAALGMSFRLQQFLVGGTSGVQLEAHTSAGGTLKLEYLHPLTQKLDLGFRLQGGAYLPPWIGDNIAAPNIGVSGGYASAGLILQAYW